MGNVFGSQARRAEIARVYEASTLLHLIGADQPDKLIHHARLKKADDSIGIPMKTGQVLLIYEGCIDLSQNGTKVQSIRAQLLHSAGPTSAAVPVGTGAGLPTPGRFAAAPSMFLDVNGIVQTDEVLIYWKSATELVCRYSCQTGGDEVILKSIVADHVAVKGNTQFLALPARDVGANSSSSSSHAGAAGASSSTLNALTNSDLLELLAGIPFFASIPREKLALLTDMSTIRVYPSNCVIFREDDGRSTQMFVTLAGTLEVSSARATASTAGQPLATLGPGSFFGEMALLINIPRAATVTAVESCMLMSIEKDAFHELLDKTPDVKDSVYRLLKERLWAKALVSGVVPFFASIPPDRMRAFSHAMVISDTIRIGDVVIDQESGTEEPQFAFLIYGALEIIASASSMRRTSVGLHHRQRERSVFLTPGCYVGPFTFQRLAFTRAKVVARAPSVLFKCAFANVQQLLQDFPVVAAEANIAWFGERCDLASVLRHAVLTQRFQTFLQAEHSDENFAFCMDVEQFRASSASIATTTTERDVAVDRNALAARICVTYIQTDAPKEVNLPAALRDAIVDRLATLQPFPSSLDDAVPLTLFDAAWDEIMRLMTKDSFPRFKKSPLFLSVLDALDPHLSRKGSKVLAACHVFRDSLHSTKQQPGGGAGSQAQHEQGESVAVQRLNRMLSSIRKSQTRHQAIVNGPTAANVSDPTKVRVDG